MRILITRTDRIGDVMLSTPVITALKAKYPDCYLAFCIREELAALINKDPLIDEVILYDKKNKHKSFKGMWNFAMQIRKKRFDMALILHPTNRMNLTCFLAGIPKRIGYNSKMGYLLTDKLAHTKHLGQKHELEYTLDIPRILGIDLADKKLRLVITDEDRKQADIMLKENHIPLSSKIVAVHPGASCCSKRWFSRKFSELIDELNTDPDVRIILVGGASDKEYADRVLSFATTRVINFSNSTSLRVLAALFERSKVLVSNDSGPVHIAVAMGLPVIDIFGRKDPGLSPLRWGPLGKTDVVLHKDIGCKKCFAHNCTIGFKCLDSISVDEVLRATRKFL